MKKVAIIVDRKPIEVECIDAPTLTTCGADIKNASGTTETYFLYRVIPGSDAEMISDGEAVILDVDSPVEFFTVPQATMAG